MAASSCVLAAWTCEDCQCAVPAAEQGPGAISALVGSLVASELCPEEMQF